MKPITEKEIADAILRDCAADLDKIEQAGIPRRALVTLAALVAKSREAVGMSEQTKQAFRDRVYEAKLDGGRIDCPDSDAERLQSNISAAGQLLRRVGRKDHDEGIAMLVDGILRYGILRQQKDFNRWGALSRVLAGAYIAAGFDAGHITDRMLRREAKRRKPL
jgi:hypothetical protein